MAKFDMVVTPKNNAGASLGGSISVVNQPTKSAAEAAVRVVLEARANAATANAADLADALSAFDS